MLVADIEAFLAELANGCRLLGIDQGTKTLGLAISDAQWMLAAPISTIKRTKLRADLASLGSVCQQRDVGGLVIGYPLNMDGSEGPRCQSVRAFVRDIEKALNFPILLMDERFSTDAAHDAMLEAGRNYSQRRERKDQTAAALILQKALDSIQHHNA